MAPSKNPSQYNWIYDELVESEDDLFGRIAYTEYKRHKIQEIKELRKKNGREPTREELEAFQRIASSHQQQEFYRKKAEMLLEAFASEYVAEEKNQLRKEFEVLCRKVQPHSFLRGVGESFVGSLAFTVLWALVLIAFLFSAEGREVIFNIVRTLLQ